MKQGAGCYELLWFQSTHVLVTSSRTLIERASYSRLSYPLRSTSRKASQGTLALSLHKAGNAMLTPITPLYPRYTCTSNLIRLGFVGNVFPSPPEIRIVA